MKYLLIVLVLICFGSCSQEECFQCLDFGVVIESSDQFKSEYQFTIPNFAVAGLDVIPLFSSIRKDHKSFSIIDPKLTLTGENSEVYFDGNAASFILGDRYRIPVSLMYIDEQLQQGQIEYEISFKESISNMPFSVKGTFLLVSCETYILRDIKNLEECRNNVEELDNFSFNYGC